MSTHQKPLPLVPGCLAMFITGRNTGKIVTALHPLPVGQDYMYQGKTYHASEKHAGWWQLEGLPFEIYRDIPGEWVTATHGIAAGETLMRIDGGKGEFTAQDCFIYTSART